MFVAAAVEVEGVVRQDLYLVRWPVFRDHRGRIEQVFASWFICNPENGGRQQWRGRRIRGCFFHLLAPSQD